LHALPYYKSRSLIRLQLTQTIPSLLTLHGMRLERFPSITGPRKSSLLLAVCAPFQ